jgi:DNA-binding NarL/FixJ family response regulator
MHREGIAALLAGDDRLHVTALAPSEDGLRHSASADVVVVDTSAQDVTEQLQEVTADGDTSVVALGVPDDEHAVVALAELGVLGFVERDARVDDVVSSVLSAARREASFPPRIATTLLRRISSAAARRASKDASALTMRERQVVHLIGHGLSNKEIATRLFIEVATVKNHVHNILEKLEVSRRSDAAARLRVIEGGRPAQPASTGPGPRWDDDGPHGSVVRGSGA